MIGFIVDSVDIVQNIKLINQMMVNQSETFTTGEMENRIINNDFEHTYCSKHTFENCNIILYHLMFDFSKNMIAV